MQKRVLKVASLGNLSLRRLWTAQGFCLFQRPLGFMISFQAFHANSAPRLHFPLIKTGPQTPVQHDKSLWSSHFSTKTIQQCVDSALPPLPTFVVGVCLVLRLGHFIGCWGEGSEVGRWWLAHKRTQTHTLKCTLRHHGPRVSVSDQWICDLCFLL